MTKARPENRTKEDEEDEEKDEDSDERIEVEEAIAMYRRYLYIGEVYPVYEAKPRRNDVHGERRCRVSRCIDVLAADQKTELLPIDEIKLAMDSSLIRRSETLVFCLALCAKQKKSPKLREAAYYFVGEHSADWEKLALFVAYVSRLSRSEKSGGSGGWGRGMRNAVNKWYLAMDATSLARLVVERKSTHGWTHKDIFKLTHPDAGDQEPAKRAVLKYVVRGLDEAEKAFQDDSEAKGILEYVRRVEELRRCRDDETIVKKIISGGYTIRHIDPRALRSKEVWCALLENMDLRTILENLPKMNRLGMLTRVSPATRLIVGALTREDQFRWNGILPGEILQLLNRYEDEDPTSTIQRRDRGGRRKRPRAARLERPDVKIREALRTALDLSRTVDITRSSTKTYLVVVRLPGRRRCSDGSLGRCIETGLSIALPLFHRPNLPDDAVTVLAYRPWNARGLPVEITRDTSYSEALGEFRKLRCLDESAMTPMPLGPPAWFLENNKTYDVYINVTDESPPKGDSFAVTEAPDISSHPRFINVIVGRTSVARSAKPSPDVPQDILTIDGFDSTVPWIIEAYVRGLF